MRFQIESNHDNREMVIDAIHPLGTVTERYDDGSFEFTAYDAECVDEISDILDDMEIESEFLG